MASWHCSSAQIKDVDSVFKFFALNEVAGSGLDFEEQEALPHYAIVFPWWMIGGDLRVG